MAIRRITSHRQRWRDGPAVPCFSWPSNEVTEIGLDVSGLGDVVIDKGKMPQWRYRIAHGLNATTDLEATSTTLEYTPGHLKFDKWCGGSTQRFVFFQYDGDLFEGHTSVWVAPTAPSTSIDPQTRDEALVRAIADARNKQNHFRGGNFIAELRDTIRGLRNPVKGFRGLLDTYHGNARKRVKNAVGRRQVPTTQKQFRDLEKSSPDVSRAAQRALSDSWLEANFGWSPLLSDAVDAYQALRRLSTTVPLERFFGRSSNDEPPTYASNSRVHSNTEFTWTVRTVRRYEVTVYGAVKIETGTPTGRAIEEMGIRARDFVPAVWEAIPYSFLIDYFSNVGDVIEAVSFPRSDIAWAARTFRNHSLRSTERCAVVEPSSPAYPANNGNVVRSFSQPRVEWDRKYVNRKQYLGSFVPHLRLEIPGSKNWRKWCNVAALARLRSF